MQSKLDTDPDLSPLHLKVVHVDLVNKAGNEYKGIATVKTSRGTSHDVPIDVTSDGDKTLWEAAPGAFLFAVQDMPTPTLSHRRHLRHAQPPQSLLRALSRTSESAPQA